MTFTQEYRSSNKGVTLTVTLINSVLQPLGFFWFVPFPSSVTLLQLRKNFLENTDCALAISEIYMPPNGRGFSAENGCLPPLLCEFLMLGFYGVGRGAFSYCLRRTPIFVLIHYLLLAGTHKPRNTHATLTFCSDTPIEELLTSRLLSVCDLKLLTPLTPYSTVLTLCVFAWQVSRGHEGVGGPGCCSEQLKQRWAKTSWMASVGSASSTSLATSSYATTTTGSLKSMSYLFLIEEIKSVRTYNK